MKLIEVNNKQLSKAFLQVQIDLYKGDEHYIRPLDQDIEDVFDLKKNKLLQHGQCIRWLVQDDAGEYIGRVAAFINTKTSKKQDQPTGGMGFFDCVDSQSAANILFDACRDWLKDQGMEAMDGPINFGSRERWWGCLVDGFKPANYAMPYNYPYYQGLFEQYGFELYFKQNTYGRPIHEGGLDPKVQEKADRIFETGEYTFRCLEMKKRNQYAEDFRTIYNQAWVAHAVGEMPVKQAQQIFKAMKAIVDPNIVMFAYHLDKPVAFFICIPEINQIIRHLDGKMNFWGKLKFLYLKKRGAITKVTGQIFGVVPDHQRKGMEGAIVMEFAKYIWSSKSKYQFLEMNWIGDFNPKMMAVAELMGGKVSKIHHTYRYLFDREKEYKRHPILK